MRERPLWRKQNPRYLVGTTRNRLRSRGERDRQTSKQSGGQRESETRVPLVPAFRCNIAPQDLCGHAAQNNAIRQQFELHRSVGLISVDSPPTQTIPRNVLDTYVYDHLGNPLPIKQRCAKASACSPHALTLLRFREDGLARAESSTGRKLTLSRSRYHRFGTRPARQRDT